MITRPTNARLRVLIALLAILALLAAAACGDDDSSDADTADEPPDADEDGEDAVPPEPELTELTVGLLPTLGVSPFYLAIENGYFADEGLTVTPEMAFTGVTEALVAGEYDIVYSAYTVPFQAVDRGLDLRVLAEADRAGDSGDQIATGVVVMPDSPIQGPEDLEGATIAAPTVAIGELILFPGLKAEGVDTDRVNIVEVPFPNMLAAMEAGNVDAVSAPEPLMTQALEVLGARAVFNPFEASDRENSPIAGYIVQPQFAEQYPGTVAAFRRALDRAAEEANADRSVVEEVIPTFMELDEELIGMVILPDFRGTPEPEKLQEYIDLMLDLGLLESELVAEDLIA